MQLLNCRDNQCPGPRGTPAVPEPSQRWGGNSNPFPGQWTPRPVHRASTTEPTPWRGRAQQNSHNWSTSGQLDWLWGRCFSGCSFDSSKHLPGPEDDCLATEPTCMTATSQKAWEPTPSTRVARTSRVEGGEWDALPASSLGGQEQHGLSTRRNKVTEGAGDRRRAESCN